ncbi:MAG: hypothetical protein ACOCWG_06005 [bacterium]
MKIRKLIGYGIVAGMLTGFTACQDTGTDQTGEVYDEQEQQEEQMYGEESQQQEGKLFEDQNYGELNNEQLLQTAEETIDKFEGKVDEYQSQAQLPEDKITELDSLEASKEDLQEMVNEVQGIGENEWDGMRSQMEQQLENFRENANEFFEQENI